MKIPFDINKSLSEIVLVGGPMLIKEGSYGEKLSLKGPWDPEFGVLMKKRGIRELSIMPSGVGSTETLDFLAEVPWLIHLQLLDSTRKDIQGIHALTQLRKLHLGDYSKQAVDFTRFPQLEECYMEFSKNRLSVAECLNLTSLTLQHYSCKDFEPLSPLRNLNKLSVIQGSLGNIEGLQSFPKLTSLTLAYLRNLQDTEPIRLLKNLRILDLEASKNFRNLDFLYHLPNLVELNIAGCGDIESLAPVLACPKLERIRAERNTTILDGDLTPLLSLKRLELLWIAGRKHYNLKRDEIPV